MANPIKDIAQLIFPHQLFKDISYLKNGQPVFLVEEYLFFKQYKFHKQKIAFHRASMKFYEHYLLEKGFDVQYIESSHQLSDSRSLMLFLAEQGFKKIRTTDPCDFWLEKRIRNTKLQIEILDSPLFINSREDLKIYFDGKTEYHQTDFYKQQRKTRNILMADGKPIGGKWTFDKENRKKYPKNKIPPPINFFEKNDYSEEAKKYTETYFGENYGLLDAGPLYPINFETAESWFFQFLEYRFLEFGIYEDSILENEHFLHHSVLSPLMNVGLLSASDILEKAITYAKNNAIPINSLEGFVRQILGWREFVRGVYLYQGTQQRIKNYWKHQNQIPTSFYTANTGIRPIDSSLKKVLKTGYAHHIERLMIFANFMNLCQFHPDHVYQWFMELFIDAYDWVMVPNVYGMSSCSDGGKMSTKPYISGSNYIKKMSDYPDGNWMEDWDALFWNFINDNRSFFSANPRLGMMVTLMDKMSEEKQQIYFEKARAVIQKLTK